MNTSLLLVIVFCLGFSVQNLYARKDLKGSDARGVVASAVPADGAEYRSPLINPSFDESKFPEPPECDEANGWERWGAWANRHIDQSLWPARNGSGMIAYHHWKSDSATAGWSQVVTNLTGGCCYRFSVWAQWEPNCNASNVQLRIEPLTEGVPFVARKFTSRDVGEIWTYLAVQARLPRGVTGARLVIECIHGFGGNLEPAQGAIKCDDARLEKAVARE